MKHIAKKQLNYRVGLKDGLPIGLGYLSVSFAFGVQASALGVPVILTTLISMTNLTSAGQLAGLPIIATALSGSLFSLILEMIICQIVINARYFLMSIALSQRLEEGVSIGKRMLMAFFVTDEIFAVGASQPKINLPYVLGLATFPYLGWASGTILGAIASNILPHIISNSLGIALYAMFIAIIVPPSTKDSKILVVILISAGVSCALFFTPVINQIPDGFKIIISAIISAGIMAFFPRPNESFSEVKENVS